MYDELIKRLRCQLFGNCPKCHMWYTEEVEPNIWRERCAAIDAIDAIKERCSQVDKFAEEAARLYAKLPRWIPVTERLPKHAYGEGDSVLTVSSLGSMRVLYFDGGNWCYPTGEALTTARKYPITHWMPLPQPPEEE